MSRRRDRLLSPLKSLFPKPRKTSPAPSRPQSPVQLSDTASTSTAVGSATPNVTPTVLSTPTASRSMVGHSQAPAPAFTFSDISDGSSANDDQDHGSSQPAAAASSEAWPHLSSRRDRLLVPGPIGTSSPSEKAGKTGEGIRVAFEGLKTTLRAIKESSDCFVPLKSAVGGFLAVVDAIEVRETSFSTTYDPVLNPCLAGIRQQEGRRGS
jgi:hypothetical protein